MWSSVATRYQDGLLRQAGSVTAPFSASTAVGTWESAMNAASFSGTSAAKDAANLSRSRNRNPLTGGRIGGTGAPGGGSAISEPDRLPRVGRERRDVGERGDIGVVAGLGDDDSAVGMADQHGWAVEAVENLVRGGDVAVEGEGGVLHDGYPVTVGGEVIVDALPA